MYRYLEPYYEQLILGLSLLTALVCLFLPLAAVAFYATYGEVVATSHNAEVTVGIAVIFRATARRLLRASFQNILRTTFGTVSRAFARTATRRFIRIFAHSFFGALFKSKAREGITGESDDDLVNAPYSPWSSVIALLLGFVGLSLSFWGVLYLSGALGSGALGSFAEISLLMLCLLSGLPILVYGLVTLIAAKLLGVEVRFETSFDGLLIQGYFTGAGSFLPMTTDITYDGEDLAKARLASTALLAMVALHWALFAISQATGSVEVGFASAMFIVYAFVYTFPISPLEGHDIWRVSKLWWLVIFLPVLISFLRFFPNELTGLL